MAAVYESYDHVVFLWIITFIIYCLQGVVRSSLKNRKMVRGQGRSEKAIGKIYGKIPGIHFPALKMKLGKTAF